MLEFKGFGKIPRIDNVKWIITEKIDGTNAAIVIDEEGNVGAQSRTRLITIEDDNYGFAQWVQDNKENLLALGPGHWYGEWWGKGINRNYGLKEQRFSLFNPFLKVVPECCNVVPVIEAETVVDALAILNTEGSLASPGYMRPEGIVLQCDRYHTRYKLIIDK